MTERAYDIVLFGATGFTGGLTAEYLAGHAPEQTRWALAGRNQAKLEQVRRGLAEINPGCAEMELLQADIGDGASIRAIADCTRVVITTGVHTSTMASHWWPPAPRPEPTTSI